MELALTANSNLLLGWGNTGEVLHLSTPGYSIDARLFPSDGYNNRTGASNFWGGTGLEIAANQLIYGDAQRLLFWNRPLDLTDYQNPDGVVGVTGFFSREPGYQRFVRMRSYGAGRLWVIHCLGADCRIVAYQLPLQTGAMPVQTITSPLPLQGGGVFTWTWALINGGIDIQPGCDCLWLSDEESHRVFRVSDASTHPVVDIILGQTTVAGTHCNQGRGRDHPSRTRSAIQAASRSTRLATCGWLIITLSSMATTAYWSSMPTLCQPPLPRQCSASRLVTSWGGTTISVWRLASH